MIIKVSISIINYYNISIIFFGQIKLQTQYYISGRNSRSLSEILIKYDFSNVPIYISGLKHCIESNDDNVEFLKSECID